jgi:hypothetical protein
MSNPCRSCPIAAQRLAMRSIVGDVIRPVFS